MIRKYYNHKLQANSRRYFFYGSFVFLCLVLLMLSRQFNSALWSPAGKGLTSLLLLVMSIVFLLLSHVVSWVRCGTWLYRFWSSPSFLLKLLDFFCSCIKLYILLSLIFVFSPFCIIPRFVFTRGCYIDRLGIFHSNQTSICLDPHQK